MTQLHDMKAKLYDMTADLVPEGELDEVSELDHGCDVERGHPVLRCVVI